MLGHCCSSVYVQHLFKMPTQKCSTSGRGETAKDANTTQFPRSCWTASGRRGSSSRAPRSLIGIPNWWLKCQSVGWCHLFSTMALSIIDICIDVGLWVLYSSWGIIDLMASLWSFHYFSGPSLLWLFLYNSSFQPCWSWERLWVVFLRMCYINVWYEWAYYLAFTFALSFINCASVESQNNPSAI